MEVLRVRWARMGVEVDRRSKLRWNGDVRWGWGVGRNLEVRLEAGKSRGVRDRMGRLRQRI